jgi:hypothetical protein
MVKEGRKKGKKDIVCCWSRWKADKTNERTKKGKKERAEGKKG